MGNTVAPCDCVKLSDAPAPFFERLIAEDITVIRTDGRHQTGWRVPTAQHECRNQGSSRWAADHATKGQTNEYKSWRFHMTRDALLDDAEPHVCGWRTCGPGQRTFWPTRLTTEQEKEAWWAELDAQVLALADAKFTGDASTEEDAPCPVEASPSLTTLLAALKKNYPHHANRANRLLDHGLDKSVVRDICSIHHLPDPYFNWKKNADARHARFKEEEDKLGLEPLAWPTNL